MAALIGIWQIAPSLHATTLTWDTVTGDGSTITGGSGTWTGGLGGWNTGSGDTTWNNATPDAAIFGGPAGVVGFGGPVTASNIVFNSAYTMAGGGTLTLSNSTITANANVTIGGVLGGSTGLSKDGSGTLTLSGTNTYTGVTTVSAGTLNVLSFTDGGINSNIGASSNAATNLVLDGGTLQYSPGAAAPVSTDRLFSVGTSGGTIDASGGFSVNFANTGSMGFNGESGARLLTLAGNNAANNSLAAVIGDNGGATALTKIATGTWSLSGSSSYTGVTSIIGGTLSVSNLADGGQNSNIGAATNAAANLILNSTLQYTGAGASTDRLFTLAGLQPTLDASGTGAVTFANTGSLAYQGAIPHTLTFTGTNTDNNTLAAVIGDGGGATSITKSGAGTWVLTGANSYTGTTTLSAGVLQIGNGGTSGTLGTGSVINNASLIINRADAISLGNAISGTGSLTQAGTGTTTLTGSASYSGTTFINAGKLQAGAAYVFSSHSPVTIATAAVLELNGFNISTGSLSGTGTIQNGTTTTATLNFGGIPSTTFDGLIQNGGTASLALSKNGTGTQVLTGANTYKGGTLVNNGVLSVSSLANGGVASNIGASSNGANSLTLNGGTLSYTGAAVSTDRLFAVTTAGGTLDASGTGAVNFTNTGSMGFSSQNGTRTLTLTGTNTNNNTIAAVIGDNGGATSLTKSDVGTWVLTGANSYTGTTTINGGVLQVGSGSTLGTLGSGSVTDNGNLTFNHSNAMTVANTISGFGGLTQAGTAATTVSGTNSYTGVTLVSSGVLNVTALANGGSDSNIGASSNAAANLVLNGGTLKYSPGAAGPVSTDRLFSVGTSGGTIDASGGYNINFTNTGSMGFNGQSGARTLTLTGNNVNGNTLALAIGDNGGATSVTKAGGGIWMLTGASTYTGVTTVSGTAVLEVSSLANGGVASSIGDSTNAASNLVLNGGTFTYTGAAVSTDRLFSLGTSGITLNVFGSGGVNFTNTGSMGFNGQSGARTLTLANSIGGTSTIAAVIGDNGGATAVTHTLASGTWALTGANTYTGVTTINGGILSVTNLANGGSASGVGAATNAATTLVLNGGTLQYTGSGSSTDRLFSVGTSFGTLDASGTGAVNFTNTGSIGFNSQTGTRTLTLTGTNTGANTLAAVIGDNSGATTLTKTGAGTWVLTGNNSYTGPTTISAGSLQIGNGGTSGTLGIAAVTDNGNLNFNRSDTSTVSNTISGSGSLTQTGAGTTTLSGSNSYTGVTTITGGVLNITAIASGGSNSNIGASSSAATNLVLNGGTLQYRGAGSSTDRLFSVGTSGGTLDASGTGAVDFTNTGSMGYKGQTGTRTLTLTGTNTGSNILAAVIGDNGGATSLVKSGTGTWILTGNNTYTGTTTISGGTLALGNHGSTGSISGNIVDNGILLLNNTSGLNLSQTISGTGAVTVNGGESTLGGTNTYTGVTTVLSGVALTVTNLANGGAASNLGAASSAAGNIVLNNGYLRYAGTGSSTDRLFSVGFAGGGLISSGTGAVNFTNTGSIGYNNQTGIRNFVLTGTNTGANTLAASIGDNGGATILYKDGAGTWILTGANGFSGGTTISDGLLQVGNGGTSGTLGYGAVSNNSNLTFKRSDAFTVSNVISGIGTLTQAGTGTVTLSGVNTYTGVTVINAGVVKITSIANGGSNSNIGASTNAATNLVLNGGALQYAGAGGSTDRLFSVGTAGGTLDSSGSSALTFTNTGSMGFNGQSGARTLTLTGNNANDNTLAAVIGDNGGATSVTKAGGGIWVLSGASTYTGATTMTGTGVLKVSSLANGGVASSIGASTNAASNLVLNGGTFTYTGGAVSTDRLFSVGTSGATLNVFGSGGITFTNTESMGFNGQSGARTLTLANASGGTSTIAAVIGDNGGPTSLTKINAGIWALTGANTYTGVTSISGTAGVTFLKVTNLANGGSPSNIGASSNAATNLVLNGGTLQYSGAGSSTDRLFSLGTKGISLDASGTGDLNFTNTGSMGFNSQSGARTLTLIGNSLGFNTIAAVIGDNAGATSVLKAGTGKWVLTGNNTYSGTTTISGGVLQIGHNTASGSVGTGNIVNNGILVLFRSDAFTLSNVISGTGRVSNAQGSATLTGLNTYTGFTSISAGTLIVDTLANGGSASNVGASTSVATNLQIEGGMLKYIGSGASTDRLFSIGVTATIDASGTGALNFTNTGLMGRTLTMARTLTLTGTNTDSNTLAAVISDNTGATRLVKSGVGTWVLTGTNTYTGTTTISGGVLSISNLANGGQSSSIGAATNAASNLVINTTLQYTGAAISTDRLFSVGIDTAPTLDASGTGAVNFTNTGSLGLSGSGTRTLNLAGTNTDSNTLAAVLGDNGGATALTKSGFGTWVITGANTYTGGTLINAGRLQVGSGGTSGTLGTGAVIDSAALIINRSDALTLANTITGTGTFTQAGTGTTTFTGTKSYSGITFINAGTLQAGGSYSFSAGSAVVLASGAFLELNGFTNAIGVLSGSGTVQNGSATGATLNAGGTASSTFDGLIQNGGSAFLAFNKNGTGTLTLAGSNTYTGGTIVSTGVLSVSSLANGGTASNIGAATNAASSLILAGGTLRYTGPAVTTDRLFTVTTAGGTLDASGTGAVNFTNTGSMGFNNQTGARTLTLTGANTGSNTIAAAIGDNGGATTLVKTGAGTWVLSGSNTYTGTTTISAGSLQIGSGGATGSLGSGAVTNNASLTINRSSDITIANTISGSGTLTQAGTGTTMISGTNSYTGVTTITAGVLNVTSLANGGTDSNIGASSNAAANLVLDGGTLQYTGSTNASTDRLFSVGTGGGVIDVSGSGTLNFTNTGSMGFNGQSGTRTLMLTGTNTTGVNIIAAAIGDFGGATALTIDGDATWLLTGTNTYTGGTTLSSGVLQIGGSSLNSAIIIGLHAILELNGSNASVNSLAGSGTVRNNSGIAATLTLGGNDSSTAFSGTIQDGGAGAFSLVKTGAGTFTLSGTNSYSGTTTISAGGLQIGTGGTSGTLGTGNVINNAALTVNRSDALTIANVISGSGALTQAGLGSTTLTGISSYTGSTTVNAGVLSVAVLVDGGLSSNLGASTNAATNLVLNGGTLQYTGGATSTDRLFSIGSSGGTLDASATGAVNFTNTGSMGFNGQSGVRTLILTGSNTGSNTLAALIADNGGATALTKSGAGTWVLTATNTYTGSTTINAGVLQIGNGGTTGTLSTSSALITNGTLAFNRSNAVTQGTDFGTSISGSGGMTQAGIGTLTLNAVNTYAGVTSVNSGTLQVTINNALGTTAAGTAVSTGATLALNNVNYSTAEALTLNGTGVAAGGALLNSGTSTYAGSITAATDATISAGGGILNLTGGLVKDGTVLTITGGGTVNVSGTGISGASAHSDLVVDGVNLVVSADSDYNGPTTVQNSAILIANASIITTQLDLSSDSTLAGTGAITTAVDQSIFLNGMLTVGDPTVAATASTLALTTSGTGAIMLGAGSVIQLDLLNGAGLGNNTGNASAADSINLHGRLDATTGGTLVIGNPNTMTGFHGGDQWQLFNLNTGGANAGSLISNLALNASSLLLASGVTSYLDQSTGVFSIIDTNGGLATATTESQALISASNTVTADINGHLFNLRAGGGEEADADSSSISAALDEGVIAGQGDGDPQKQSPIAKHVPLSRQWEVFATVNYGNVKLSPIRSQAGVQVDSWASGVGVQRHLSRGLILGFATSFLQSTQGYTGNAGSLHLEGPALSTYLSYVRGSFWNSLLYSFGTYQMDSTRNPGAPFPIASGSTHTYTHSIQYNTGWNFRFQNNTLVTGPFLGVDYLHGTVDAYNETGGGIAALHYSSQSFQSLVSRVGWAATKKMQTSFATITPQVRLSYERQNVRNNNGTSVSLLNVPFSSTAGNQHPGQDYLVAGMGVNIAFTDRFSLMLSYQGQFFRHNLQAHFGSVRLSYKF